MNQFVLCLRIVPSSKLSYDRSQTLKEQNISDCLISVRYENVGQSKRIRSEPSKRGAHRTKSLTISSFLSYRRGCREERSWSARRPFFCRVLVARGSCAP